MANEATAAPRTHDGFYMSLSGGLGYLSSSVELPAPFSTEQSMSGMTLSSGFLLGGTIGSVVLGGGFTYDNAFSPSVEQDGQEADLEDVELYLIGIDFFVDYYFHPNEGFHILGALGWGGLESSYQGNVGGSDPTGTLFTLGAGYDMWFADEWSIGPLVRFTYAPLSLNDVDYSTTQIAALADLKFH